MTSPIQLHKTYGVLHTESFFSFLGFAKKVGNDEIQQVDIYLDDNLIDTIEANEFIQKIDDIYDVENQAFTYNLPLEYVGKKAKLSFKNHDSGDELLNSPYILIDKNHEKFNEAIFVSSLFHVENKDIETKICNDNIIGFLITDDNLKDEEFIKLMNILFEKDFDANYKAFYFNNEQKALSSEIFDKYISKIDFVVPKNIFDIVESCYVYIHSSIPGGITKSAYYHQIWQVLNQIKVNMFLIHIDNKIENINNFYNSLKLVDNSKIRFEQSIISKIFENDERYNEFKFMNSLNQPITEESKNIYKPNSIGFLATKENLEDEEFMGYIKELMERFPDVEFKGFCFKELDNKKIKQIFQTIEVIILKSLSDVMKEIELFVFHHINDYKSYIPFIINVGGINDLTHRIYFVNDWYKSNLKFYNFNDGKDPYNFNHFLYGYTSEEIKKSNNNNANLYFSKLIKISENTKYEINPDDKINEWYYFKRIDLLLKYPEVKKFLNRTFKVYINE